jgi:hypothetical protein
MSTETCVYCRALPLTNNSKFCICKIDCGSEFCTRVASGEPEYAGTDVERPYEDIQCQRDYDEKQRGVREQRARDFQAELREIADESGPGKPL